MAKMFIEKSSNNELTSALIATHNFELADKMDRKVKLQDGKLIDLRAQVFAPGENFY